MKNFANQYGYTDITPYEVVRVVSDKTLEVRRMNCEKDESLELDFVVGGFSSICTNNSQQKWHITSDEDEKIIRIRYSKAKNVWRDKGGNKFQLSDTPSKFYDYNF